MYLASQTFDIDVALRKESVDRNIWCAPCCMSFDWSLSARRAWIEISVLLVYFLFCFVALRKESVDRNVSVAQTALKTG